MLWSTLGAQRYYTKLYYLSIIRNLFWIVSYIYIFRDVAEPTRFVLRTATRYCCLFWARVSGRVVDPTSHLLSTNAFLWLSSDWFIHFYLIYRSMWHYEDSISSQENNAITVKGTVGRTIISAVALSWPPERINHKNNDSHRNSATISVRIAIWWKTISLARSPPTTSCPTIISGRWSPAVKNGHSEFETTCKRDFLLRRPTLEIGCSVVSQIPMRTLAAAKRWEKTNKLSSDDVMLPTPRDRYTTDVVH